MILHKWIEFRSIEKKTRKSHNPLNNQNN